jgi:ubiquinone/menaquinone biosynthesis C-methylase UbiE
VSSPETPIGSHLGAIAPSRWWWRTTNWWVVAAGAAAAAVGIAALGFPVAPLWHGVLTGALLALGLSIVVDELRHTRESWRHHRDLRDLWNQTNEREERIRAELAEAPRYAGLWNPSDEPAALMQIFNTDDPDSFEEGGRWDLERLRPWFGRDSTVLDLGCGIGRVARYVAPECAVLWAVDASQKMLDMAAERLRGLNNVKYAHCHDVRFPDVPSESVDMAYSLLVLQHLEREDAFLLLEELRRVIRPGGTVILTYPNLLSETYMSGFLDLAHRGEAGAPARARLYTPQEVEALLPAAGFRAEIEAGTEIRVTAHPA